jgi:phage gp36-like protein
MSRYGSIKQFQQYSKAYPDNIDSAEASNYLVDASSEIDTIIAKRYDTPVTGTPPMLALLCSRLAAYRALDSLLSDVQPNASEANTRKLAETLDMVTKIGEGDINLVSSAGTHIGIAGGGKMAYGAALSKTLEESTSENKPIQDWLD